MMAMMWKERLSFERQEVIFRHLMKQPARQSRRDPQAILKTPGGSRQQLGLPLPFFDISNQEFCGPTAPVAFRFADHSVLSLRRKGFQTAASPLARGARIETASIANNRASAMVAPPKRARIETISLKKSSAAHRQVDGNVHSPYFGSDSQ